MFPFIKVMQVMYHQRVITSLLNAPPGFYPVACGNINSTQLITLQGFCILKSTL